MLAINMFCLFETLNIMLKIENSEIKAKRMEYVSDTILLQFKGFHITPGNNLACCVIIGMFQVRENMSSHFFNISTGHSGI